MASDTMTINIGGGGADLDSKAIVDAITKLGEVQSRTNSIMEGLVNNIKSSVRSTSVTRPISSLSPLQEQLNAITGVRTFASGSAKSAYSSSFKKLLDAQEKAMAESFQQTINQATGIKGYKSGSAKSSYQNVFKSMLNEEARLEITKDKTVANEKLKTQKLHAKSLQEFINTSLGVNRSKSSYTTGLKRATQSDYNQLFNAIPEKSGLFNTIGNVAGALSMVKLLSNAANVTGALYTNYGQVGTTVGGLNPYSNGYQYGSTYGSLLKLQQQRTNLGRTFGLSTAGALAGGVIGSIAGPVGTLAGAGIGSSIGAGAGYLISSMMNAYGSAQTDQEAQAKGISLQNNIDAGMFSKSHRGVLLPDFNSKTGEYTTGSSNVERQMQMSIARGLSKYGGNISANNILRYQNFSLATGMAPEQAQSLSGLLSLNNRMGGTGDIGRMGNVFAAYNLQGTDAVNSANLGMILQSLGMPNAQEQAARLQTSAPNWASGFQAYNSADPFVRGLKNRIQKAFSGYSDVDVQTGDKNAISYFNKARTGMDLFRDMKTGAPSDKDFRGYLAAQLSDVYGGNIQNANTALSDLKNVKESGDITPTAYQQIQQALTNSQLDKNLKGFNMSEAASSIGDLSKSSSSATDSLTRFAQALEHVTQGLAQATMIIPKTLGTYSGRTDSTMGSRP